MDPVFTTLAAFAESVPVERMNAAAGIVERLQALSGYFAVARTAFPADVVSGALHSAFARDVAVSKLSPAQLAAAMQAAATTAHRLRETSRFQILWTGPDTSSVPVRRTEQALCDLVDMAKETLFVVSFVAFKADRVYAKIVEAVARGVKVSFLTESSKEHGGSLDNDPIKLLREKIPGAMFYRWTAKANVAAGCVHAKCAIADRKAALITSANLTEAAMENNMERGLLVENEHLAGRLADHFAALATEKIIERT